MDSTQVVSQLENHRLIATRDGFESELVYERRGSQLVLLHTEVPGELRGKGVGGLLVEAAIDWAKEDGLVIVPWCPFARRWLHEHETLGSEVQIEWGHSPGAPLH